MKTGNSGPNRLTRVTAKEVPHRTDERFFAAKTDVKNACETLLHDMRHSVAHAPMVTDFVTAVTRMQQQLKDITPDVPKASSEVRDMGKEVQHLQFAHTWVSATERVFTRLGSSCSHEMRDKLLEAQDSVMWCVRAQRWDGELTASVTVLQKLVQVAEVHAARVVG